MARVRRSRPDSDIGFQVKALIAFLVVPSSLGSGLGCEGVVARQAPASRASMPATFGASV